MFEPGEILVIYAMNEKKKRLKNSIGPLNDDIYIQWYLNRISNLTKKLERKKPTKSNRFKWFLLLVAVFSILT